MPRTSRRSHRSRRTASRRSPSSDEARAAGVILDTLAGLVAPRRGARPAAPRRRDDPPAGRQARPAHPGRLEPGRRAPRAGRRPPRAPDRPALVGRGRRPGAPDADDRRPRRGRRGVARRGARGRPAGAADRGEPQALFTGTARGPPRPPAPSSGVASIQDLPDRDRRLPAPPGRRSARARRSTGRSPSSARGSSGAASTTASSATGSSVEQVEIVFGADDQLFDLTSYTRHIGRDTTGNLLSKAALLGRDPHLHEGPDHHREDRASGPTASSASSG